MGKIHSTDHVAECAELWAELEQMGARLDRLESLAADRHEPTTTTTNAGLGLIDVTAAEQEASSEMTRDPARDFGVPTSGRSPTIVIV